MFGGTPHPSYDVKALMSRLDGHLPEGFRANVNFITDKNYPFWALMEM